MTNQELIEGTVMFDGAQAIKGYALNKMCFSFNEAANRAAFLSNEEAYMSRYGLTEGQKLFPRQAAHLRHRRGAGIS